MKANLPVRQQDKWGAGYFGAPRGNRAHRGIDYSAYPGTEITCLVAGVVSKIGYAYADDPKYRYVQVTDSGGYEYRYFYLEALVKVGDPVDPGDVLGRVQDLGERYEGITGHVHYEIRRNGKYLNPAEV